MRPPLKKPCGICGEPVTPTYRKDTKEYYYPRQCKNCHNVCRNPERKAKRLRETFKKRGYPNQVAVGTRTKHNSGSTVYWQIKTEDPNTWKYEHRHVIEQQLGRALESSEIVHHVNDNTLDNRLENLQLMSLDEHTCHHHTITRWSIKYDSCRKCKSANREHCGYGLCSKCHASEKYRNNLAVWGKQGRWAEKFDCCCRCRTTKTGHASHGLCHYCYKSLRHDGTFDIWKRTSKLLNF